MVVCKEHMVVCKEHMVVCNQRFIKKGKEKEDAYWNGILISKKSLPPLVGKAHGCLWTLC